MNIVGKTVCKSPKSTISVLTTISLAPNPVSIETEILQSLNPKGTNIGASILPIEAKKLSSIF